MTIDPADLRLLLQRTPFLQDLSPGDIDKVAAIASRANAPAGSVLFEEGETCWLLYIVTSGRVAFDMCRPRQGCTRILTVGPGELIGWSALLGNGTMTVRATAVLETQLICLPAQELQKLCDDDHDIGYAIMRQIAVALSRRLLATRLQTLDMFRETQPLAGPVSQV